MNKTQYQHYLPRCYLQNFTELNTLPGREPAVFVYDFQKPGKSWHKKAPSNVAGINDYYAFFDEDGSKNNEVEEFWGRLESHWPNLLAKIEDPRYEATEGDRLMIASFVASFIARVPAEIEDVKGFVEEFYKNTLNMLMKIYASKPDLFEQTRQRIQEETGADMSDFKPENVNMNELSVHVPTPFAIGVNLNKMDVLVNYLMNMSWLVVRARDERAFITSDRPVCSRNVEYKGELIGGGWDRMDILITFPLSHKLALCTGWDDGTIDAIRTGRKDMLPLINTYSSIGAKRLLIASSPEFPGAASINRDLLARFAGS